jgi:hypothetical protein
MKIKLTKENQKKAIKKIIVSVKVINNYYDYNKMMKEIMTR